MLSTSESQSLTQEGNVPARRSRWGGVLVKTIGVVSTTVLGLACIAVSRQHVQPPAVESLYSTATYKPTEFRMPQVSSFSKLFDSSETSSAVDEGVSADAISEASEAALTSNSQLGGHKYDHTRGMVPVVPKHKDVGVVGLSHKTAGVECREFFATQQPDWNKVSREILEHSKSNGGVLDEVALLSTCNRFEVMLASKFPDQAVQEVQDYLKNDFISQKRSRDEMNMDECEFFSYAGKDAARHVLSVAAGLDSLVVGEAQILRQIKMSFEEASKQKEAAAGKAVLKLLENGIKAGKRVRTETDINKGAVSVGSAALEFIDTKYLKATSPRLAVLGAGDMAITLLRNIASASWSPASADQTKRPVKVICRDVEKAKKVLAEDINHVILEKLDITLSGEGDTWDNRLNDVDALITCASSHEPLLTRYNTQDIDNKVMLVDIAIPRNIAPDLNGFKSNLEVYNLDHIQEVVTANQQKRQGLIKEVESIVEEDVKSFNKWQRLQQLVPMIKTLEEKAAEVKETELNLISDKLSDLKPKQKKAVEMLAHRLVNKMLHHPLKYIRESAGSEDPKTQEMMNGLVAAFDMEAHMEKYGGKKPSR